MDDKPCLLFCDTFVHENVEEIQLDLIGFARAVAIAEIRVIPHGCKVHPDIRDRLGETKPSSFKLELFIKNLTKPNATVFEKLGFLDYEEGKSIQMISNSQVATNVVLVRGLYHNLTISLYGHFANNLQQDPQSQVPPPPPVDMGRQIITLDGQLPPQVPGAMQPPVQMAGMQPLFIPNQGIDGQIPPHSALPPHMEQQGGYQSPSYGRESPQDDRDRYGGGRDSYNDHHRGMDRRREDMEDRDRRRMRDNRDRFDDDRRGRREYYDRRNDHRMDQDRGERFGIGRHRNDSDYHKDHNTPENSNWGGASNENVGSISGAGAVGIATGGGELFEPLSPESSDFEDSQVDENNSSAPPKPKEKEIGYEDIESDEDLMLEDCEFDEHSNLQNDFDVLDENWASISLSFNPYQCSLSSLEALPLFTQSEFQKMVLEFKNMKDLKEPSQLRQLQDHIVSDSEAQPRDAKWVTMLEDLPNIIPTALAYLRSQPSQKIKERHFVAIITEWAVFCLNMDNVCSLPLAVNIRLLKAGLKLTSLLACSSEDYQRMLIESDVQEKLMELLQTEYMASSLKLLILKAIDSSTNTAYGMENFLGWNTEPPPPGSDEPESIYEKLVLYLLNKPTVRIVASVRALLQKAHFYESISNLQSISARITRSATKEIAIDELPSTGDSEEESKQTKTCIALDINHKDMCDILSAIENIHNVLVKGNSIISQPNARSFPTAAKMQNYTVEDCYPTVIRLLQSRRFLESIVVLISSPLFCEPPLYIAIQDLLFMLMSSQKGLLFLSMEPNTCNGLIRTLLDNSGNESEEDYSEMPTLKQYMMTSEIGEQCTPHHIGLLLVYHLQSLQGIDQLLSTAKPDMPLSEMDSNEHISMLHTLYAMTLTLAGRDAVASTLAYNENLNCLLPFLTGEEEDINQKTKKSVCNRYAAVLLSLLLNHSEDVEYVEVFGAKLLNIHNKENDHTQDIHHFITPLENISKLDVTAVSPLIDALKSGLEELKLGSPALRCVLMSLRLLKRLVKKNEQREGSQKDLHQKVIVMQMISSNAMDIFIQIFHKVCQQLQAPWKQNEPFSNPQCTILVNISALLLEMTDMLLTHILTTSYTFKDARLVQGLFTLHKIVCTKPPSGCLASILTRIQENLIQLLIKFLQGTTKAPHSEEAVKTSTWYILFKELLVFASAKPENFTTGLILLSELLPIPLPVHSLQGLSDVEVAKLMNHRLFSMANFSCLGQEIKLLLKNTIGSCCSALQYYLRRVLCQLIDLGASVSSLITRCLCEMIDDAVNKTLKESEENASTSDGESKEEKKKRLLPSFIYNTFSLLSYLACQPGGKASFLNLVTTTEECVSEFASFIPNILNVQSKEGDWFYLENCLLPLVQSICDHELCLTNFNGTITRQHLSNNLPTADHLNAIVEMLFQMLSSDTIPLPLLVRCLGTVESLTDHDYGMVVLKKFITEKDQTMVKILDRLYKEASEGKETPIIYAAISAFLEFLNLLNSSGMDNYMKPSSDMESPEDEKPRVVKTENNDEQIQPMEEGAGGGSMDVDSKEIKKQITSNVNTNRIELVQRSIFISASTLKSLIKLDDKNSGQHALSKLEKLIEDKSKEDEELISLSQAIVTLRMIIIASVAQKDESIKEVKTTDLVTPEPLKEQFNSRLISVLMNVVGDERATQNDWFDIPAPEEIDEEACNEAVTVDMLSIAEKYLPNFKYKEEVEKGFVNTTEMKRSKRMKGGLYKPGERIDDTKRLRFDVSALNTPPSMRGVGRGANRGMTRGFFGGFRGRGRGFGRGRGRGRGSDDSFRQRRQNTSRPPSMHVDDFVSMENKGDTVMSHHLKENQSASAPSSDRYSSNNNYNSPARWNGGGGGNYGNQSNFRRNNDVNNQNQQGRNTPGGGNDGGNTGGGGGYGYNRQHYGGGGGRFHNRSNSDWTNKPNYSYRGSRDGAYSNRPNRGGSGGGYWAGPKQQNDRFFTGGSYRPNRGRHQRTFTR